MQILISWELVLSSDSIYLSLLTTTKEPIFASSEGNTVRILIDSDNSADTGYSLPGVGADQMVEMYGKGQTVLSSILYSFNDNRDSKIGMDSLH